MAVLQLLGVIISVRTATSLSASVHHDWISRATFGQRVSAFAVAGLLPTQVRADDFITTESGLKYKVVTSKASGASPKVGDLIAIRFKGSFEGRVFDDITATPEPLYYRVGGGSLIAGIDEVLPLMKLGETFELVIPGKLGFGPKGRPATAGKPRIPANAELEYQLSIVGFPGYEGDLIDTV